MPNPVLHALSHVWMTLAPLRIPMALMGGLAVAAWKHPRSTRDVDILIAIEKDQLDPMLATLAGAGVRTKHHPAMTRVGEQQLVQFLYEAPGTFLEIQIDLLIADGDYQKGALGRCVAMKVPGTENVIGVLSCEDLVIHKLLAGRLIDRADASALVRVNRGKLDLPYLHDWINGLNLAHDFAAIWEEAFPGGTPEL